MLTVPTSSQGTRTTSPIPSFPRTATPLEPHFCPSCGHVRRFPERAPGPSHWAPSRGGPRDHTLGTAVTGAVAGHLPLVPTTCMSRNTLPSGLSRFVCSGLFCTAARPILCPTHELFSGTGTFQEQSERGKGLTSGPWECGQRWGRDQVPQAGRAAA